MNTRFAFCAALFALFAPFLTGCMCTNAVGRNIGTPCYDKFKPSAVYKREHPVSFALEGTRETRSGSFPAFLIVDNDLLVGANAQTNQTLSVEDIRKVYELRAFGQDETQRKIPPDYVRVTVLPKNDLSIDMGMYQPGGGWGYLMPFAYIVDIVTFPFQAIYVAAGGDPGWRM